MLEPLSICSKDALPLARTFYESCLEACFLLSDSGDFSDRAQLYTIYKLFKTQRQFYKLGTTKGLIEHPAQLSKNSPQVQKALKEFEPKGSRQVRRCFGQTREEKIQSIRNIAATPALLFEGVEQMNWDHASEIAHGSLFSYQLLNGLFGQDDGNNLSENVGAKATHAVALCSNAVACLVHQLMPELKECDDVIEACNLYYQEQLPEIPSLEGHTD